MTPLAWTMRKRKPCSGFGGFPLLFLMLLVYVAGGAGKGSFSEMRVPAGKVAFASGGLSSFQRVTLGIPLSVNTDTALGLTAVPGIGPKTAAAIVRAREGAGGFKQLKDLMSIRRITPSFYQKIKPYLTL